MLTTASLTPEEASSECCMTPPDEIPPESGWPKPLLMMKGRTRIGTWNACTLYKLGRAAQVANKMRQYNINCSTAICESRWNGAGQVGLATGKQLVYSRHKDEQHAHIEGVALMLCKSAAKALIE